MRIRGSRGVDPAGFVRLLALNAFAVLQPLLDLLKRHTDFLVVHRAGWADVAVLALVLTLGPPLVLWIVETGVGLISRRAGRVCHVAFLASLTAAILLPLVDAWPWLDGVTTLAVAAVLTTGATVFFVRSARVQRHIGWFALAAPVFLGAFVASGEVRGALASRSVEHEDGPRAAPVPVVLIVFDELPRSVLVGEDGRIDADLFPGFARLAAGATWYSRASSVSGATLRSVPTIFTGRLSDWRQPATLNGHPENLFTVLGRSHRVIAHESQTSLCPDILRHSRLGAILADVGILYRHVLYPRTMRARLPAIDNRWTGFGTGDDPSRKPGRYRGFEEWVERIDGGGGPIFAAVHELVPHNPYRRYPDGTIYSWRESEGEYLEQGVWIDDPAAARDAYRRLVIQTMCVDRLMDRLLDRLETKGLWDEAMIVVTADHGASFAPGQPIRTATETNIHDIMNVPLLIRYPGQRNARVDHRHVQSVDIYPTILETVGLPVPADLRGFSLVDPDGADRDSVEFQHQELRRHMMFPVARLAEHHRTRQWRPAVCDGAGSLADLLWRDDHAAWRGVATADLPLAAASGAQGTLDEPQRFADVRPESIFVPGEITGRITRGAGVARPVIAVAVNGRISGVNEAYRIREGEDFHRWSVLVPKDSFVHGENHVEIFVLAETDDGPVFRPAVMTAVSTCGERLGARRHWSVRETGFHRAESWGDEPFRWTTGDARLEIPLDGKDEPAALALELVSTGPSGTDLVLRVNGDVLHDGHLQRGPWAGSFPLSVSGDSRRLVVEITSTTFREPLPDDGMTPARDLGVGVSGIVVSCGNGMRPTP